MCIFLICIFITADYDSSAPRLNLVDRPAVLGPNEVGYIDTGMLSLLFLFVSRSILIY